jgi:hypothetical protein
MDVLLFIGTSMNQFAKEQALRLGFGLAFFFAIAVIAVLIDVLSGWVTRLGASQFTIAAMHLTAHALLVLDGLLLLTYLFAVSLITIRRAK